GRRRARAARREPPPRQATREADAGGAGRGRLSGEPVLPRPQVSAVGRLGDRPRPLPRLGRDDADRLDRRGRRGRNRPFRRARPRAPGTVVRMGRRSFKAAAKRFFSENRLDDAAALTYYSVLSIFPGILVGTSLIGMLDESATRELLNGLEDVAPADAMSIIEGAVTGLQTNPATAGVMALVGLAAALWAASNYIAAFSRA